MSERGMDHATNTCKHVCCRAKHQRLRLVGLHCRWTMQHTARYSTSCHVQDIEVHPQPPPPPIDSLWLHVCAPGMSRTPTRLRCQQPRQGSSGRRSPRTPPGRSAAAAEHSRVGWGLQISDARDKASQPEMPPPQQPTPTGTKASLSLQITNVPWLAVGFIRSNPLCCRARLCPVACTTWRPKRNMQSTAS